MSSSSFAYSLPEQSHSKEIDYVIDIVSVSKKFRRHTRAKSSYTTFKSALLDTLFRRSRPTGSITQAIRDLTLRIPKGSSVGIIGRNGSGKSTLLKLITGIYKPSVGNIRVNGRIAALIELGAGFHPDFTGRENLELGGVMHGLSRDELKEKFDQIVRFAELEAVIDDPVKTYSSGMFMRLGFSLAIHTNPDVLIVDEVLAVGDAAFVGKCKEKIAELRREQKTLLLVTHDLDAVERWCDEVIWLESGEVRDRGDPRRVIDHYRQFIEHGEEAELADIHSQQKEEEIQIPSSLEKNEFDKPRRWGSREIEVTSIKLKVLDGTEKHLFHTNDSAVIEINYIQCEPVTDLVFGIAINRSDGLTVHGTNTDIEGMAVKISQQGSLKYIIKRLSLLDGQYTLDVAAHRSDGYPYDYHKNIITFAVRSGQNQIGVFEPEHSWEFY